MNLNSNYSDKKWENDSTYIGEAKNNNFYFLSPISQLKENEDDYNRHWVYMSKKLKKKFRVYLRKLNTHYGYPLPIENGLTSYSNPDYLWLSYELENLRRLYNMAMRDPNTGKIINGCGQIPYIQLCLKSTAHSIDSLYPEASLNAYGKRRHPHYVITFQQPFLKAFINFIFSVFDDNPQTYVVINGKKVVTHQFIAPIYRIPPFDKHFDHRHDLPGIMISKAIEMLLAHEMAHVGNGHLDLKAKDKSFGTNKDTVITEENDADIQAIYWILGTRFLEIDGEKPDILNITYDDFKDELALSVFAAYLLYTWPYSKEDRIWSEDTIKDFGQKDHLPYQLRAYTMLASSIGRLENFKVWCTRDEIKASDGRSLDAKFFDDVIDEIFAMIHSFERSLHMFFSKTEDVYFSALDNKLDTLRKMAMEEKEALPQLDKENIPWLIGLEQQGQDELKRVNELWKSVRQRLSDNGTYCRLRPYEEWKPIQ